MDESWRRRQLAQAVSISGLNVGLILVIITEITYFLLFRKNLFDVSQIGILIVIVIILISFLSDLIYVKKKRYEYIISTEYKPFNLSITLDMAVCFLVFIVSFSGIVGTALVIGALLKK